MSNYIGQRLSFEGERCTVRFIGSLKDKPGQWLGIEWDNAGKGKHDGSHNGVRYFSCQNASQNAGSFIRPNRPSDRTSGLIEAIEAKYALPSDVLTSQMEAIHISGKTVEEVGFEKIQRQLASLTELKIIILDSLCVKSIDRAPQAPVSSEQAFPENLNPKAAVSWLRNMKVVELDLSRNLLETWSDVLFISNALPRLKTLKLAGNRFRDLSSPQILGASCDFTHLTDLTLDDTLLDFPTIASLVHPFTKLTNLSISYNRTSSLHTSLHNQSLKRIDLSYNDINSIQDLQLLTSLPALAELSLRSNPIANLNNPQTTFPSLKKLDLTSTLLLSHISLNPIPQVFPLLTHLLTKATPLSQKPSASLLTIARIPTLTELNYSPITTAERQNAELYYMSTITKQLAEIDSPAEEQKALLDHPQWLALCEKYGKPDIPRKISEDTKGFDPGTLGARIALFEFHLQEKETSAAGATVTKSKLIPTTISTYRLLGIAASLFSLTILSIRLILETDEFDPVGEDDGGWSVSEDESDGEDGKEARGPKEEKGKWVKREEELGGSTKPVGDWLPVGFGGKGAVVRIRVEVKEGAS